MGHWGVDMTFPKETLTLAGDVVGLASEKKILLTTAESCTGGLVAAAITEIPGVVCGDVFPPGASRGAHDVRGLR